MTTPPAEGPAPHGAGPRPRLGVQCAPGCYAFLVANCTADGGCPRAARPRWDGPTLHDEVHPAFLVPPGTTEADICRAFGVEPWMIGLAPAPPVTWWRRHVAIPLRRAWLKITGRW